MQDRTDPGQVRIQGAGLWLAAQLVALLATVAVIVGLFAAPAVTLGALWKMIIPLVPASLLVSPMLWRNVCPLATLTKVPGLRQGQRTLSARLLLTAGVVGMVLLALLVTLRHVLFNGFNASDGAVLASVIVGVAVLALVLGRCFDSKVGFCNSICPVLPVERLYGQRPLLVVSNPRCTPCRRCTAAGCIDLTREGSIPELLAQAPSSRPWFLTSMGAFAAAFPGFVLGYNLAHDGPPSTTGQIFGVVGLWTLVSFAVTCSLAWGLRVRARHAFPALGATAAGIYYWFSAPVLSRAYGLDPDGWRGTSVSVAALAIRAGAFVLIATWLWRALPRRSPGLGSGTALGTP
jgi:hypothetical protein